MSKKKKVEYKKLSKKEFKVKYFWSECPDIAENKKLSARSEIVLKVLFTFLNDKGYACLYKKTIAKLIGVKNVKTVYRHLKELKDKGFITIENRINKASLYYILDNENCYKKRPKKKN